MILIFIPLLHNHFSFFIKKGDSLWTLSFSER